LGSIKSENEENTGYPVGSFSQRQRIGLSKGEKNMKYLVEPSNMFGILGGKFEACVNLKCCVVSCINLECTGYIDGKAIPE